MKTRFALLVSVLVIASMLLTACPAPAPQTVVQTRSCGKGEGEVVQTVEVEKKVVETQVVEKIVQATAAPEPKPIVSWSSYDAGNIDPKADEHVGNDYCAQRRPGLQPSLRGQVGVGQPVHPW